MFIDQATVDLTLKIWGAISGSVGTALGIYNLISSRRKEKREGQKREEDWQKCIALRQYMQEKGANLYTPELGSEEHKWAERVVERGLLERGIGGIGYVFPQTINRRS